jgi:hypothetical protein
VHGTEKEHGYMLIPFPPILDVMDYSLVVGVDSVRQELVVGIVGEYATVLPNR